MGKNVLTVKVWDDANNQGGRRPDNVYFHITRGDGRRRRKCGEYHHSQLRQHQLEPSRKILGNTA